MTPEGNGQHDDEDSGVTQQWVNNLLTGPQGIPVATELDVADHVTNLVDGLGTVPETISQAAGAAAQRVIDVWLDGADPRLDDLTPRTETEAAYAITAAIGRYPRLRADILAHAGIVDQDRHSMVKALALLADLDRCQHGRHSTDSCLSCPGGHSAGNPHNPPGHILGYDYAGRTIAVPVDLADRLDPAAWYGRPEAET